MENPPASPLSRGRVEEVLDRLRSYLAADGGNVELVNVNEEDGIVFVRFQGACVG